jgi:hypothetical protein
VVEIAFDSAYGVLSLGVRCIVSTGITPFPLKDLNSSAAARRTFTLSME